jgi:hypothetical protein
MPIKHILVDFENTQPQAGDVALVPESGVKLWIFRGPSQKKYDAEFAEALLPLGSRVAIVKCEKSGRNALDMHIAFQMGRLVGELARAGAPAETAFVVVSRDTDYDPLLAHVRAQGFEADRATSLAAALGAAAADKPVPAKAAKAKAPTAAPKTRAAAKAAAATKATKAPAKAGKDAAKAPASAPAAAVALTIEAAAEKIVEHFRDHPRSRPARRAALEKWLASHLRGRIAEGDVAAVVAELERRGVLSFNGTKVEYAAMT